MKKYDLRYRFWVQKAGVQMLIKNKLILSSRKIRTQYKNQCLPAKVAPSLHIYKH